MCGAAQGVNMVRGVGVPGVVVGEGSVTGWALCDAEAEYGRF